MNICSKKVVVDYRISNESVMTLKSYGFDVVFTKKLKNLYDAVDGHTDLQIVRVGEDIITCPECFEYYSDKLDKKIICGHSELKSKYPEDVFYNAAIFGKFAVHNFRFTDSVLRECIKKNFLFEMNVNQGYSKCSICIVSDRAIITEDESIIKKFSDTDIDVLKIEKGPVKLKGLDCGFLGGATGLYENKLFVNGELSYHTDGNKIKEFCKMHGVDIIELKNGKIHDIGSIFFII